MCTVTFIAKKKGYHLGMNRDEKLARPAGLPPCRTKIDGRLILNPAEPSGGMWIAVNETGETFALINWYSVKAQVEIVPVTRGKIIPAMITSGSPDAATALLGELPLKRINPFRLIGLYPTTEEIVEWRWDLQKLVRKKHPWKIRQWVSSGFDEPVAQKMRAEKFHQALQQVTAGSLDWLRRLHRSHSPGRGPFSNCMHRPDAATVSYTEITFSSNKATMCYHAGSPCGKHKRYLQSIPLRP